MENNWINHCLTLVGDKVPLQPIYYGLVSLTSLSVLGKISLLYSLIPVC